MPKTTREYRSWQLDTLSDPQLAASYLNAAMNDSPEMFLKALRNVAQAHQMTRVAKEAGVKRESLYRALSTEGNPTLDTLVSVLSVLKIKTRFAAEGAEFPAPPTVAPQKRPDIAHKPKKRALHGFQFRRAGQLELAFPNEIATAENANVFNAVAHTVGVAWTGYARTLTSNSAPVTGRDEAAPHLNQESGGLSRFSIPPATPNRPQGGLNP
ncbi:MAG TPA: addiction module antidote protein [Candidatus Binatia bacterium]|jgi:probable addiction module antidote protein|nr:addiction module antidote protein [Candidatus Binatia bacterium]